MTLLRSRLLRALAASSSIVLAPLAAGCSSAPEAGRSVAEESITDVDHSSVKRQSIGNCWVYAAVGWLESLNKRATGQELNASESWVTFWHWYEQILGRGLERGQIGTGGRWSDAVGLLERYGVVEEGAFIAKERAAEMSSRQATALATINTSLKTGALSTAAARRDRELVLRELARAWRLSASVVTKIHNVFGPGVTRDLSDSPPAPTADSIVKPATTIAAAYARGPGLPATTRTLADALRDWRMVDYPRASRRREFLRRVQRALHDDQPVVISWFVDFNALDDQGRFFAPPAAPGHQGGHMTLLEDYTIDEVPGFGTLVAGTRETSPAALEAALADAAKVRFFRVKNSWGKSRADREFVVPGYHDLYMPYLDGPVQQCATKANGDTDPTSCWDATPLSDVILPPGY